jgi:hypothetical protein
MDISANTGKSGITTDMIQHNIARYIAQIAVTTNMACMHFRSTNHSQIATDYAERHCAICVPLDLTIAAYIADTYLCNTTEHTIAAHILYRYASIATPFDVTVTPDMTALETDNLTFGFQIAPYIPHTSIMYIAQSQISANILHFKTTNIQEGSITLHVATHTYERRTTHGQITLNTSQRYLAANIAQGHIAVNFFQVDGTTDISKTSTAVNVS